MKITLPELDQMSPECKAGIRSIVDAINDRIRQDMVARIEACLRDLDLSPVERDVLMGIGEQRALIELLIRSDPLWPGDRDEWHRVRIAPHGKSNNLTRATPESAAAVDVLRQSADGSGLPEPPGIQAPGCEVHGRDPVSATAQAAEVQAVAPRQPGPDQAPLSE